MNVEQLSLSERAKTALETATNKGALWFYRGVVTDAQYDGDTWYLTIDLGFKNQNVNQKIRLLNIDTPEVRGTEREDGIKVRDFVRENFVVGQELLLRSYKDQAGKFDRYLFEIIIEFRSIDNYYTLNQYLFERGFADKY